MLYQRKWKVWSEMAIQRNKTDYQTLSLFITLAVLTLVFVFGVKWIVLTPAEAQPSVTVESVEKASK